MTFTRYCVNNENVINVCSILSATKASRYQKGDQKPYSNGQTIQWPTKGQNDESNKVGKTVHRKLDELNVQ